MGVNIGGGRCQAARSEISRCSDASSIESKYIVVESDVALRIRGDFGTRSDHGVSYGAIFAQMDGNEEMSLLRDCKGRDADGDAGYLEEGRRWNVVGRECAARERFSAGIGQRRSRPYKRTGSRSQCHLNALIAGHRTRIHPNFRAHAIYLARVNAFSPKAQR